MSEIEGTSSPVEMKEEKDKKSTFYKMAEVSLFEINGGGEKLAMKTTTGDITIKKNIN